MAPAELVQLAARLRLQVGTTAERGRGVRQYVDHCDRDADQHEDLDVDAFDFGAHWLQAGQGKFAGVGSGHGAHQPSSPLPNIFAAPNAAAATHTKSRAMIANPSKGSFKTAASIGAKKLVTVCMDPRSNVAPWRASWSAGDSTPTGKAVFESLCTVKQAGEMPVCHSKKTALPVGAD